MKPFECLGPDGRVYLHYDNWQRWRAERFAEYPCPSGKYRFDIEISYPRANLTEVPIERNPHNGWFSGHACFYCSDNWSTIYGVHDAHLYQTGEESWRMLVESGNPEPLWGERITLMSTSSTIENEPWGMNPSNKFAFFRGRYWRIVHSEFMHVWTFGPNPVLAQSPARVRSGSPGDHLRDIMVNVQPMQDLNPFTRFTIPIFRRAFPQIPWIGGDWSLPEREPYDWKSEGF